MAIQPGYNQFPRQRVPQISAGINNSNIALKALKEVQDKAEADKLAAQKAAQSPKVVVIAQPQAPTPTGAPA